MDTVLENKLNVNLPKKNVNGPLKITNVLTEKKNLPNLEKIRSIIFHLITAPLKLKNATGSPIRAIALID